MNIRNLIEMHNQGYLMIEIKQQLGIIGNEKEEKKLEIIMKMLNSQGLLLKGEELQKVRNKRRQEIREEGVKRQQKVIESRMKSWGNGRREKAIKAKERYIRRSFIEQQAQEMLEGGKSREEIEKSLNLTREEKSYLRSILETEKTQREIITGISKDRERINKQAEVAIQKEMEEVKEKLFQYEAYIRNGESQKIDYNELGRITRLVSYSNSLLFKCLTIYEGSGKYQHATVIARAMIMNEIERENPDMDLIRYYEKREKEDIKRSYYQQVDGMVEQGMEEAEISKKMEGKLYPYAIHVYLQEKRKEREESDEDRC